MLACCLCVVAIECPVLDLPSHTRLTNGETGHTYGTTLNYQCSEGHELISGDLQTSCEATGKWSGQEPLCRGKFSRYSAVLISKYICMSRQLVNFES